MLYSKNNSSISVPNFPLNFSFLSLTVDHAVFIFIFVPLCEYYPGISKFPAFLSLKKNEKTIGRITKLLIRKQGHSGRCDSWKTKKDAHLWKVESKARTSRLRKTTNEI